MAYVRTRRPTEKERNVQKKKKTNNITRVRRPTGKEPVPFTKTPSSTIDNRSKNTLYALGGTKNNIATTQFENKKLPDLTKTTTTQTPIQYPTYETEMKQPKPYTSTLQPEITKTLQALQNYPKFKFDTQNPALLQAQKQAMEQARKESAKRGRVFDTYAQIKEQEAAQRLLPQFYGQAKQDYQTGRANLLSTLGALSGQEQQEYKRYQDVLGQTETQRKLEEQQEERDFGVTLSPIMREYRDIYNQMTQDDFVRLTPFQQDYQAKINELKSINPNDPDIQKLEALRASKILSDPALLNQYGQQYGMQTRAIKEMSEKQERQKILDDLEILKSEAETLKEQMEIEKIASQIAEIEATIAYKDAQTVNQELMAIANEIENSFLPKEKKAQLDNIANQIWNRNRQTSVSEAREKRLSEEEKKPDINKAISDEIATYKSYPTKEAIKALEEDAEILIGEYGVNKYKEIWDGALRGAIRRGETQKYSDYYKEPDEDIY